MEASRLSLLFLTEPQGHLNLSEHPVLKETTDQLQSHLYGVQYTGYLRAVYLDRPEKQTFSLQKFEIKQYFNLNFVIKK